MQVDDAALLGRRHREVREAGLVQAALAAAEVREVLVEDRGRAGARRRVTSSTSNGFVRGRRVAGRDPLERNASMYASSGVAPGRDRTTCSMSENTSTVMFGNRLYCDMSSSWPSSSVGEPVVARVDAALAHDLRRSRSGSSRPPAPRARARRRAARRCRRVRPSPRRTPPTPAGRRAGRAGAATAARTTARACRGGRQIRCGPFTSSHIGSISRWMPCTWYVSLKPSISVFQLHGAGDRHRGGAAELVDARPRAVVGHRAEELGERLGVGGEVHEDERSPRVDLHRDQAGSRRSSDAELAPRRHLAERARRGRRSSGGTGSGSRSGRARCPRTARSRGAGTRSGTRAARRRRRAR